MSGLGGHPILTMGFNSTIAASAGGTAAATVLNSSFPVTNARYMQIFNYTLRDLELIFSSAEPGTSNVNVMYVPGTAASTALQQGILMPINMQSGAKIMARTTINTPVTMSATLALRINFWA